MFKNYYLSIHFRVYYSKNGSGVIWLGITLNFILFYGSSTFIELLFQYSINKQIEIQNHILNFIKTFFMKNVLRKKVFLNFNVGWNQPKKDFNSCPKFLRSC